MKGWTMKLTQRAKPMLTWRVKTMETCQEKMETRETKRTMLKLKMAQRQEMTKLNLKLLKKHQATMTMLT